MKLSRYVILEKFKPLLVFIAGIYILNEDISFEKIIFGLVIILSLSTVMWIDKNKNNG
jgi:EamA domain-containing membrane protein RarD